MDAYVYKNGEKLRFGYTTGTCAAGAAKAAVEMLFGDSSFKSICVTTNNGTELKLGIEDVEVTANHAKCCIVKDSGDDPDITNGIKVYAKARKLQFEGISVVGGEGVGVVTKRGLSVEVGRPAINPGPMRNIIQEVSEILPKGKGVEIEISVPGGEELAKKTFNPKLGIVGGISIIGTTGIVEPMSEDAYKTSLSLELSMLKEQGVNTVVFSPGNYGRDFCKKSGINLDYHVRTSNYIGYMLEKAVEYGFEKVLWVGHIGKMIKVAGGIFNTHSKIADARMEIMAANCILCDIPIDATRKVLSSITTDEASGYIKQTGNGEYFDFIAGKISTACEQRIDSKIKVGTIIFSNMHGFLGMCGNAGQLLEEFKL